MECSDCETLGLGEFRFRAVLALGPVAGFDDEGPIVRSRVLDHEILSKIRGVYIIRAGTQVAYCGKYTGTFAERWLYTRDPYVYHNKRMGIALSIAQGLDVTVFAETETELQRQLNDPGELVESIEANLISRCSPPWNRKSGKQGRVFWPFCLGPNTVLHCAS